MAASGVSREALAAAFDTIDAAMDKALGIDCDAFATQDALAMLERCERFRRRIPAVEHPLINNLARQATPEELGGKLSHAIADATLISRAEAGRRIRAAADLGARHGLTGEPMEPVLAHSAAAQRDRALGPEQVAVIRKFWRHLPAFIDQPTRDHVEALLASDGSRFRPEQLTELAAVLADCLNPDGTYTDDDRSRRRGLTLGPQGTDGMSPLRG